jgi:hypothetical protein
MDIEYKNKIERLAEIYVTYDDISNDIKKL